MPPSEAGILYPLAKQAFRLRVQTVGGDGLTKGVPPLADALSGHAKHLGDLAPRPWISEGGDHFSEPGHAVGLDEVAGDTLTGVGFGRCQSSSEKPAW